MIDERTSPFDFPLPNAANTLAEDVVRLRQSLIGIDDALGVLTGKVASDDPALDTLQKVVTAAKAVSAAVDLIAVPTAQTVTYDADGLVASLAETLADGRVRTTAYAYSAGMVVSETVAVGARSYRTTYSYAGGKLVGSTRETLS